MADLYLFLYDRLMELDSKVCALQKNSRNSSKPPSSDQHNSNPPAKGKKKGKGKRKPGGQKGHKGRTLEQVESPDHIIEHELEGTCGCGLDLEGLQPQGYEARQVFDLPPQIHLETSEHRAAYGTCPCCQKKVRAPFPAHVNAPVQYGLQVRTLVTYLHP